MKPVASTLIVLSLISSFAHAVVLTSLPQDASASTTGLDRGDLPTLIVGRSNNENYSAILVFALPELSAGQTITNASLTVTMNVPFGGSAPTSDLDLYGLGFRSNSSVLTSDFYHGELDTSVGVTLLQKTFFTPASSVGSMEFSGQELTDYINAQIIAGATTGSHLFLRFSSETPITEGSSFYYVNANEHMNQAPTLSVDVVPEPSTTVLCSLVAMVGLTRRKRRL